MNLPESLSREIARVSAKAQRWEHYKKEHPELASGMAISLPIMRNEIENAHLAVGSGDIQEMMRALDDLKGYDDND